MTRRTANTIWCLAFVLVGLSGVALGRLTGEHKANPDLWCTGESAHQVPSEVRPAWLTTRFRLDLRPSGLSHMRMVARLIDADSGAEIGALRRNSAFGVQQQDQRLRISVERSAKGEAESPIPELSGALGMFIFRSDNSVSYWMRSVTETRYLFDDGSDMFILCSQRPSSNSKG
jgi:hypothetical protein